jgi:hypothetical protein
MSFIIRILHSAIQGGDSIVCTQRQMHVHCFEIQTFDLTIKKGQPENVYDCILIQVTVVLSEIACCTLQEE